MSFLPKDYERQESGSSFLKIKPGDNKLRIVSDAVVGQELWIEGKPTRKPYGVEFTKEELENADTNTFTGEKRKPQEFWAVMVWSYENKQLQLFSFTQRGIIDGLLDYVESEDWGDPKNYDVNIKKDTSGERTKYSVTAIPPKPLSKEIEEAIAEDETNINEIMFSIDDMMAADTKPEL